jgi:hypothetical protein
MTAIENPNGDDIMNTQATEATPDVLEQTRRILAGTPEPDPAAPAPCCSSAKQEVCCEPSDKAECCGTSTSAGGCGCQ